MTRTDFPRSAQTHAERGTEVECHLDARRDRQEICFDIHEQVRMQARQGAAINKSMRESKAEPVKAISKLVDACGQSSELFLLGSASTAQSDFQQLAQKIRQRLEQFRFELRTEIRRLGGADQSSPRPEPFPDDSDILAVRAEISLQLALDQYQHALNTTLPAHARAMITRQYSEIERVYHEFVSLHRAA